MRAWVCGMVGAAAAVAGCSGPPAPDVLVCRDVIHRLCLEPLCGQVTFRLGVGGSCESALEQRTGCAADDFAFTAPPRERVLECRLPLLRAGIDPERHPDCADVGETLDLCTDVAQWLGAAP